MFYNMGAVSTQVTIAQYSSRLTKRLGSNVTSSVFEVLAKSWDESLGGSYFDMRIANHMADHFNQLIMKKIPSLKDYDVRKESIRGWSKIKTKASKTKKVLSANEGIPVYIESVHKDVDLSGYRISH